MRKTILFLFNCILIANFGFSQNIKKCGSFEEFSRRMQANPGQRASVDQYLNQITRKAERLYRSLQNPELHQSPVTIPVVVHIVHKNDNEKFTLAEVQTSINRLNYFFRKRNTREISSQVPAAFRGLASDTYIEFELAKRDPQGNRTTGIEDRRTSNTRPFDHNQVRSRATGGMDPWDKNQYLNIWVCDLDGALGVATFPENPLNDVADGVVVSCTSFAIGSRSDAAVNQGKTLVHEIGHFLGVRHISGDGACIDAGGNPFCCQTACSNNDDFVSDTPPQCIQNTGAPTFPHRSLCNQTTNGELYVNYMDYVDDNVMHLFTKGQVARMMANLAPGGRRASLLTSPGLLPPQLNLNPRNIYLEPEGNSLPSWRAAITMVYRWILEEENQESNPLEYVRGIIAGLESQTSVAIRIGNIPAEVSKLIYSVGFSVEEINMTYTPEGFYELLGRKPVVILSAGASAADTYALVINEIGYHQPSNTTYLRIIDPLNIGPRGFSFNYANYSTPVAPTPNVGSEYVVNYARFITDALEQAVRNNKTIYFITPPHAN